MQRLTSGAKKSLVDPPKQCLALKSCDISDTSPYQLLIGGSDAFARFYDRRMLPPLSSSRKHLKASPCVCYYCQCTFLIMGVQACILLTLHLVQMEKSYFLVIVVNMYI